MAGFGPISVAGWRVGETIEVYLLDGSGYRVGDPVTSAVVDAEGLVEFSGLNAESNFEGTNGTTTGGFSTLTGPDRGGGGDGGGSVLFGMPTAVVGTSGSYRVRAAGSVGRATLSCSAAPDGTDLVVEVLLNGDEIVTLTIADGETDEDSQEISVAVDAADHLTVNATSIGSDTAAAGVVVQIDLGAA